MNHASESDFAELLNYNRVGIAGVRRGNLIKARHISCTGTQTIDVSHSSVDQPTVIMHRDGDTITAIEFICACGASTLVSLEYDPT